MKKERKIIHIVKHKLTGAEIPVIVRKMSKDNIIEEYSEYMEKRKGFTLNMLRERWDKCREDTIELIQEFQVPAFVRHQDVLSLDKNENRQPVDVAIFWEEYVYGIEAKTNIKHSKLKSRAFDNQTEN